MSGNQGEGKGTRERFVELDLDAEPVSATLELERPVPRAAAPVEVAPPAAEAAPAPPPLSASRPVEKVFSAPPVASYSMSLRTKLVGGALAVALVGTLAALGLRHRPTAVEETERRGGIYRISDHVLADEYGKNSARADRAYLGHRLRIVGRLAKVRLDFGGENALQLAGTGAWLVDAVLRPEVFREFGERVLPGQLVTVECVVRGLRDDYVRVDDCTLPDGVP